MVVCPAGFDFRYPCRPGRRAELGPHHDGTLLNEVASDHNALRAGPCRHRADRDRYVSGVGRAGSTVQKGHFPENGTGTQPGEFHLVILLPLGYGNLAFGDNKELAAHFTF